MQYDKHYAVSLCEFLSVEEPDGLKEETDFMAPSSRRVNSLDVRVHNSLGFEDAACGESVCNKTRDTPMIF